MIRRSTWLSIVIAVQRPFCVIRNPESIQTRRCDFKRAGASLTPLIEVERQIQIRCRLPESITS